MQNKKLSFIVVLISATILVFSSCSTSNKHKTKSVVSSDSTSHVKTDSSSMQVTDQTTTTEDSQLNSDNVALDFFWEDTTAAATTPVVITKKGDSLFIDPGGRKLKGVKTNTSQSTQHKDSSSTKQIAAENKSNETTTAVVKKAEASETTKAKTSWWPFVMIGALGLITYFWLGGRFDSLTGLFRKKKKAVPGQYTDLNS